jgi:5-oxopent-3-ene-1,2,5-tricarboxylate decarboxylase/2-hydroxyhepta-2,4-diene-1,7-dioate isomerase
MDLLIRDSTAWQPAASGTVYGALLNFKSALAELGEAVSQPPYKAPPRAPVLFIKPRNTLAMHGAPIVVPRGIDALAMGGTLGVVIGRVACRVDQHDALTRVAGYTVANDVSVPHANYYRPSIRHKCRDGFCPIGPRIVARPHVADPDDLTVQVCVDGVEKQRASTRELVRCIARLVADISEFMTLVPGDVVLVGVAAGAPLARAGQRVTVTIDGVGTLENRLVGEGDAS